MTVYEAAEPGIMSLINEIVSRFAVRRRAA